MRRWESSGFNSPELSKFLIKLTNSTSKMAYRERLSHHLSRRIISIRAFNRSIFSSPFSDSRLVVAKNAHSVGLRSIFGMARSALRRYKPASAMFDSSGRRMSVRRVIGFSVAYGIASSSCHVAFAMAGNEYEVDESDDGSLSDAVIDRDQLAQWTLVRKVWIPSLFFVNVVMMSWNHPIQFAIKVILALFSTKPNPFSVYIYVEQLCDEYKHQYPWSDYSKPLKATNVDVVDYGLFLIGRVAIRDQRFTLIGILGSWWVWPSHLNQYMQFQTGFVEIKNRARQQLTFKVPKPATHCP